MMNNKSVAIIFHPKLERWGLRGDPFLWEHLMDFFKMISLPCDEKEFVTLFEKEFKRVAKKDFHGKDNIYVEQFAHGGMSSGQISMEFWKSVAFPVF